MGFRYLVIARTEHAWVVERYWLRNEQTLFKVRAELMRDRFVATIQVIELQEQQEQKSA